MDEGQSPFKNIGDFGVVFEFKTFLRQDRKDYETENRRVKVQVLNLIEERDNKRWMVVLKKKNRIGEEKEITRLLDIVLHVWRTLDDNCKLKLHENKYE
jgi:hypothetical protein